MSLVSIVMYHYVRPIRESLFPKINGLELQEFRRQLDFLALNYRFVTAEDVIAAATMGVELPEDSCWLTFDDGFKDHVEHVLPELVDRKIQGSFFPSAMPVIERTMLDVHSIQHILAAAPDVLDLIQALNKECIRFGMSNIKLHELWQDHAFPGRYDNAEVNYVKRLLQFALPQELRSELITKLFRRYLGKSPTDFADDLYLSHTEVKTLVDSGMYVGSHGYQHLRLSQLDSSKQKIEIYRSLSFLQSVGARTDDWVMCYPYGDRNLETMQLLEDARCAVGLTTDFGRADVQFHDSLCLPRLNTNDFPR